MTWNITKCILRDHKEKYTYICTRDKIINYITGHELSVCMMHFSVTDFVEKDNERFIIFATNPLLVRIIY